MYYEDDPYGEKSDVAVIYDDDDGTKVLANFHINKATNSASLTKTIGDRTVVKE